MEILDFRCPVCGRRHQLVAQAEEAWGKAGKEMHISQMCVTCQLETFIVFDDERQVSNLRKLAEGQKTGWRTLGEDPRRDVLVGLRNAADHWEEEAAADPCRDHFRQLALLCELVCMAEEQLGRKDDPRYFELLDWAIRNIPYCKE